MAVGVSAGRRLADPRPRLLAYDVPKILGRHRPMRLEALNRDAFAPPGRGLMLWFVNVVSRTESNGSRTKNGAIHMKRIGRWALAACAGLCVFGVARAGLLVSEKEVQREARVEWLSMKRHVPIDQNQRVQQYA